MSDLRRRIKRLEDDASGGNDLPFLIVEQSLDDPALYHDADGNEYSRANLDRLGQDHRLIVIKLDSGRRPGNDGQSL